MPPSSIAQGQGSHKSNVRRNALTALRSALDRRSRRSKPSTCLVDRTAAIVPQRGPRGGLKLHSGVDHRVVEALETERGDNARRGRIALCGSTATPVARHRTQIKEYDTSTPKIIAERLAQLAQCTCDDGRQPSGESGAISAACLSKCPIWLGGSQTPAGGSGSFGRIVGWMCRSHGPRARSGMALGTHKCCCGGTMSARRLVE